MFITKWEYERLQGRIAELEARNEELREEERDAWDHFYALERRQASLFLADYECAVLWRKDKHYLEVWNHGRFEKGVKAVVLGQEDYGHLPSFTMQK